MYYEKLSNEPHIAKNFSNGLPYRKLSNDLILRKNSNGLNIAKSFKLSPISQKNFQLKPIYKKLSNTQYREMLSSFNYPNISIAFK